jgi:hypothetical protein
MNYESALIFDVADVTGHLAARRGDSIMTLRFSIPRRVARVVDFSDVARLAREGGVVQPTVTQTRHIDWVRIACSRETGVFLVEALRRVAAGAEQVGDRELQQAAVSAVSTVLSAKDILP